LVQAFLKKWWVESDFKAAKIIECFVFLQVTRPKDENFFNINYYQKRPKSSCDYTLNEEEYIISKDDIDRLLDPPDITT
jgi:hypothetical protein